MNIWNRTYTRINAWTLRASGALTIFAALLIAGATVSFWSLNRRIVSIEDKLAVPAGHRQGFPLVFNLSCEKVSAPDRTKQGAYPAITVSKTGAVWESIKDLTPRDAFVVHWCAASVQSPNATRGPAYQVETTLQVMLIDDDSLKVTDRLPSHLFEVTLKNVSTVPTVFGVSSREAASMLGRFVAAKVVGEDNQRAEIDDHLFTFRHFR